MKKNVLYKIMMMVLVAIMTMSFTACGGDDAENSNPNSINEDGTPEQASTNKIRYFVPYTDWNGTKQQIMDWMKDAPWLVLDEHYGTEKHLTYNLDFAENRYYDMQVFYTFENGEFVNVGVWYNIKSEEEGLYLVKETEKTYGIKLYERKAFNSYRNTGENGMYISVNTYTKGNGGGVYFYKNKPGVW